MKTIRGWDDMGQYGIVILTGEACGLGMRILCDLTKKGCDLMQEFFGSCIAFMDGSNWNGGEGHIASILLPRSIFSDLAAFCLLKEGFFKVFILQGSVVGINTKEEEEAVPGRNVIRSYSCGEMPGDGFRNRHAMTGRLI